MFKKGKLVFVDTLQQHTPHEGAASYFTARALVIYEVDGQYFGASEILHISDLILKQSSFLYDGVNTREAHKLYTWPHNLGDMEAWANSKKEFIEQHLLNFPIQIQSVQGPHHCTWEYISPEQFKKVPDGLQADNHFQQYLDHINEYFFLRKERKDPV